MFVLRDYQQKAIDDTMRALVRDRDAKPCILLPCGGGKSLVLAGLIKRALEINSESTILLVTHQKELIEQDMDKLQKLYPECDIGVYSASLKHKEEGHRVTFASIQSIWKKENVEFSIILIDECHLINNEDCGMYRTFFSNQPQARIIGLTATGYRMKGGSLVGGDSALFTEFIQTVSIFELQKRNLLVPLRTKGSKIHIDIDGVKKVAGEYSKTELDTKVNTFENNENAVKEIVETTKRLERKKVVIFCTSINHANKIAELLGDEATVVESNLKKEERERRLDGFKKGEFKYICNVGILTTGFDEPSIDCIVALRPTLSRGLWYQMLGRGLRIADGKKDCLILDFIGNTMALGTLVELEQIPNGGRGYSGKGKGDGLEPKKECPVCMEILPERTEICPLCGYEFKKRKKLQLFMDDINGNDGIATECFNIFFSKYVSKAGNETIKVSYSTNKGEINEYLIFVGQGRNSSIDKFNAITGEHFSYRYFGGINEAWNYINSHKIRIPKEIGIVTEKGHVKIIGRYYGED